jgi:hypothetical protein
MKNSVSKSWLIPALATLAVCLGAAGVSLADKPTGYDNPRPGQPGHEQHREWEGKYPTPATINDFKVVRTFAPPEGFIGNLTFDQASGRLFLVSLGPPTNTTGPSTLYELDPATGKVLAQAMMPFKGDFGQPVYLDGHLYQGVFHESKMYKVAVGGEAGFGAIVKSIPLPTINDLKLVDEAHSFPFIEFGGVTVTPSRKIMLHADDVGEYITIEPETGAILERARTIKAMGGIAGVGDSQGRFLVVANSDPRGGYCALSYPPALSRSDEQKDISWALTDGRTGDVLASLRTQSSRAYASTIAMVKHEELAGAPYGRFTFLATGEEGILEIEWTPGRDAY